ncbi:patched domain-containing protein 3-like [Porites lutea]|uniref:patched domain-containing protein 3-like n=1 Tax=Porites lutea TaxID=51062 RepID=UPI003CC61CCA
MGTGTGNGNGNGTGTEGGYNMLILFVRPCVNETPIRDVYWAAIHLSGYCASKFSPCFWWSRFCRWLMTQLERFFGWFGEGIAKHPLIIISICLVFVSVCSVGFVWFKAKNRGVDLYIPQGSRSMKDLDRAEKYFRLKAREEIVLLTASPYHLNVLDPDCLREAFKAHRAVMELESYSQFCVTLSGDKAKTQDDCMIINPLEFLQFNESNLDNKTLDEILGKITKAYDSSSPLTRNGRTFSYNFKRTFGGTTPPDRPIKKATALQMVYLMNDFSDQKEIDKVLEWEKKFIDKLESLEGNFSCFKVHYSSERSQDDAIAESSGSDITLVSITFMLMITFACVMLGKFLNPLTGHSLLANTGVFAVALGILSAFGLAMWCRVPFVSFMGVLPFLVLGIGIDDMFILVDELDRQPRDMSVTEKIKAVMSHSGATVTMTTMTDLVAFAVSTSSSFPAIKYALSYAALTVTFSYLMIITYFVASMTYDVKRIKSGRRDCLPFCRAPQPKEGALAWDEPIPQLSNRAMETWGRFLTHPATKVVVIILSLGLLGVGIYGVTRVEEKFDRRILAKDDSYLKRFLTAQEKHFELAIEVSIVETGKDSYEKFSTQQAIRNLTNIVESNEHYLAGSLSWMDHFSLFANRTGISTTGSAFLPALKVFLNQTEFLFFAQDLKFSDNGSALEASRIICFMKGNDESTFQKNAMQTLREDLETKSKLSAFPITRLFIFFEQYVITSRETIRNLIIAAITVFVITSPFLVDCTVAILVLFNFAALICELFGLMVIWGVSLNAVSMINLVMAIGFAVDYSAHIAHAYVFSNKLSANDRVVDALSTLGASFSTFLGMIVLAFAASEIFRIFFRMFLGTVGFGLIHGLCIMPVYMSLLCWKPSLTTSPSVRVSAERLGSINKKDESSHDLHLAVIGNENPGLAAENASFELAVEGNVNEVHPNSNERQENDETDYDQYIVNVFKGRQNEGLESGHDELDASTKREREALS